MKTYAEQSPYWDTTVSPAKSQGEILELLTDFGAEATMIGQGEAHGQFAWMVRFGWLGRSYRFVFTPLPLLNPGRLFTVSGRRVTGEDRAKQQMGRIALNFVKAILTAAQMNPDAFLTYYYGSQNASAVTDPIHTMTGIDRAGLVGALETMTIEDLTFRMLQPHEIGKAMAFPGTYIVKGNNREKVRQYGNAVTPPVMEMIIKRCVDTLS